MILRVEGEDPREANDNVIDVGTLIANGHAVYDVPAITKFAESKCHFFFAFRSSPPGTFITMCSEELLDGDQDRMSSPDFLGSSSKRCPGAIQRKIIWIS
jgi:hypothetical protein